MTEKLTEMVFIIDRSGSMSGLEEDTIGGFNSMIEKQKKEGNAIVSTILFSNDIQVLHDRVELDNIKKMTDKEYYVTASTSLLDAVGSTIERIKHKQNETENVPDTTLFVIITDGLENSSRVYSYKKVKGLIEQQKKKDGISSSSERTSMSLRKLRDSASKTITLSLMTATPMASGRCIQK